MVRQGRVMTWRRVGKALQALVAHGLLFSFTVFLTFKLEGKVSCSWWIMFTPLWLFHAVVARGRFSLPAPSRPLGRHWAPLHAVMATPLLVAFEILICTHLESSDVVNLKIVFVPLLVLEMVILIDNIRMCRALMPNDEDCITDEAIWEALPHFWIVISMIFFIAATTFTVLKLCGDIDAINWWDLFINFGIAECFAFLTCTKWYNPSIHRHSLVRESVAPSVPIRFLEWNRGIMAPSDEERHDIRVCNLQNIGSHIMKVPVVIFEILLFMHLEGTPPSARHLSFWVLFTPLFLLQGVGVLLAAYRLVERIVLLVISVDASGRYFTISSKACEFLGIMHRGSRLLGWWSIDERSQEEQARLYSPEVSGYNTFSPDIVRKMPKSDLVQEIGRLQAALSEQTEITISTQEEYERLQTGKILCRVCFEEDINIVILPCRHYVLCSTCCGKCKRCPICRVTIEERLPVHDV